MAAAPARDPVDGGVGLAELYRKHAGFVWRTLRRFGVPDEALEDVVHEVFMVVRRRLPEFDGRAAATTWLFGIARGVAANVRRSRARAEARHRLASVVDPPPSPEQEIERAEAIACVGEFLAGLDPDQREVFELVDIEGLRGPEVAELLATNLNVVYSRLRLARRKFEAFIDGRARAGHDRRAT
ncbi:MAG TPA: sigma-70 family RNA polymerase sigma factor [Nannocystaceae bacterium]|nr:sigma-70 family RNA polymerase sigma factor [Nannocystaceae bacterium]